MSSFDLHEVVLKGDLPRLRDIFASEQSGRGSEINAYDEAGYTPLMHAVTSPEANVDLVRLLLDHGADVHQKSRHGDYTVPTNVMALALGGGNPEIIRLLLQRGANIHYHGNNGYGALVHAVHSRDIVRDERLIDLLNLLIINGVELSSVTSYAESGLRTLSGFGRFDAVKVLLDAGADASHLQWTPLMRAVALGSLAEVKKEVEAGAALEDKDRSERTAWLLALQTGDLAKAGFLYERGANTGARGRCGKPPLFYAIENHHRAMLRWLLEIGAGIEETDDFGQTPLMDAVEYNNLEAVEELLKAGADLNRERNGQTVLTFVESRETGLRLLAAGADPRHLSFEGQRALVGLDSNSRAASLDVSPEEFRQGRSRRFGTSNPEQFHVKFCEGMIRTGISAYQAAKHFKDSVDPAGSPVWCARRFGQSITFLPDGRIVQIAGEHEDGYDPDFCIYNDVFVHHPDGAIDLFSYPEAVFPPTDFHTASLLAEQFIWVVGSLGYLNARRYGETPVYRLHTASMRMEEIKATGNNPGWIYGHTATVLSAHEIRFFGGKIVTLSGDEEVHTENKNAFILDTELLIWR